MKKKLLLLFLALITLSLGYLRDYIFVSINEKTGQGPSGMGELFFWKWPLTIGFASLYFGATCLFLHLLFTQKKYIRLAVFAYAVLFAVSFIIAATGYLSSSFENVYSFVRTVMGIAQSPIVMMVLIAACLLNEEKLLHKKG